MSDLLDINVAESRIREAEAIFEKIKAVGRDVYIFGAGEYANKLKIYLKSKGIIIKGFFVDDVYASDAMLPLSKVSMYNNISLVYGIGNAYSKKFYEKLNQIRLLPIPQNINLSKPLAILKSHAGYVMSFMNGMKSLGEFLKLKAHVEEDEIPSWLLNDGKPIDDFELWVNYCKTGGLRSRLLALYKASELLACIHAKGLCYVRKLNV